MKRRVSLKDIAQKVGVSTALVSYVLNNQKEGRISKEVAQKIKEAAIDLKYTANQIARSLKTNKTYTIGLIVSDISNPFSSSLARIIEDEAEKNNYVVLFGSSDESAQKCMKLMEVLLNRQVDGLILAPAEDTAAQIQYLQEREIPFVLIDRYLPELTASYVAIDNFKASYKAVKHLIDKGRHKIGLVTFDSSLFHLQERQRGYSTALTESGITLNENWIKSVDFNARQEDVDKVIAELIFDKNPIDAILFASNTISTLALKYINTLSIKVPDDLAIVSFDQSDVADLFYAPISHIKQPLEEMGQTAIKILLENLGVSKNVTQINLEAEFVIRKSTLL